jgi:putative ABC transport system permease protein
MVKSIGGDYFPPDYTKRTWRMQQYTYQTDEKRNYQMTRKRDYELCAEKMTTPEIILGTTQTGEYVDIGDQKQAVMMLGVTDNYFDVVKLKFLRGRPLNKQEIAEAMPVAVIDKHTADMYFGKNEDPTGKTIELQRVQYRVLGVVKNSSFGSLFSGMSIANVWIPFDAVKGDNPQVQIFFTAKDKASVADMQAEFIRVFDDSNTIEGATQHNIQSSARKTLEDNTSIINGVSVIASLLILMLIPALNILSLNVSRSYDRSEEIAVRKAFGAPKHTIFGQLFIENTLITLVGAVIGMCATPFILNAIDRLMLDMSAIPLTLSLQFDWVTIFLVAVPGVLLFSFLSGSVPAWIIAKHNIVNVLKGEEL